MSLTLNAFTGTLDYTGTGGGGTGQTGNIDDFTGSTGTVFVLTQPPTNNLILLVVNGLTLRRVNATPNNGQFTLSGSTVTTGLTIAASDEIFAFYLT